MQVPPYFHGAGKVVGIILVLPTGYIKFEHEDFGFEISNLSHKNN